MATAIQIEQIATNRYAPKDAAAINLYEVNGVYELSLGQLMMAICIRSAACIEQQSVIKMNDINASAAYLDVLAQVGEYIMSHSSLEATLDLTKTDYVPVHVDMYPSYQDFLTDEVGLDPAVIPATVSTTDEKTRVFGYLADEMDKASSTNEDQTIDLESLLSRRDSTYNASAAIIKNLGSSMNNVAYNF